MEYIASISYGKDSCTIPHVCLEVLKLPLTKLVTVDVMFNDELSAYYPEVEEFKQDYCIHSMPFSAFMSIKDDLVES